MNDAVEKSVVRKIRALLARADAARNDNEHERAIALRQATKLMDKYGISEVAVNAEDDPRASEFYEYEGGRWRSSIVFYIADLYGCRSYHLRGTRKAAIVGRLSHRQTVLAVAQFVIASVDREAKKRSRGMGQAWGASFRKGAAAGIAEQVFWIKAQRERGETSSPGQALAVVNHYLAENDANDAFLKNSNVKLRMSRISISNGYGYGNGKDYGSRINLRGAIPNRPSALLRGERA